MKIVVHNKNNMLGTTANVLEKYKSTWSGHVAFTDGVGRLTTNQEEIERLTEIVTGNSGATKAKKLALERLTLAASEVIGAVLTYATRNDLPALIAAVSYSPSALVAGKAAEVVARCKTIHTAANSVIASLADFGITPAKLLALKNKIDAFDELKTAPRENVVKRKAASQLLERLTRESVAIAREELDELMPQFKEANPGFYEEYFAARVTVDMRGGQSDEDKAEATPLPVSEPQAKAA